MIEFFIGILIMQEPEKKPIFDTMLFANHADCAGAIRTIEANIKAYSPEGTEIRLSCISSESIGQNSV